MSEMNSLRKFEEELVSKFGRLFDVGTPKRIATTQTDILIEIMRVIRSNGDEFVMPQILEDPSHEPSLSWNHGDDSLYLATYREQLWLMLDKNECITHWFDPNPNIVINKLRELYKED